MAEKKHEVVLMLTWRQIAALSKLSVLAQSIPPEGGVVLSLSSQLVVRAAGLAILDGVLKKKP